MKSLFVKSENEEFITRIGKLTPQTSAVWGKMNVSQMLTHCQRPLEVAFGQRQLKQSLIGILLGGLFKKLLTSEKPFSKNSPTDKDFIITDTPPFDSAKDRLIELVREFEKRGPSGINNQPHPFFGKMSVEDWDKLSAKHLDHHLRQFGV
ncbi:MAG: DUF1569 domain-containing protein [Bacteroidetes bacterium]|nr:DUF1569 domain-containing protein [Bacteroidota bacterium]